ncbi:hypothetical protein K502DRAFT_362091 [Neoconidiobolus thromboides FSU 785]|nr:hypothetical protein K502DRAFT_362091 [Neoconidiobolus thromboides FSU 785]
MLVPKYQLKKETLKKILDHPFFITYFDDMYELQLKDLKVEYIWLIYVKDLFNSFSLNLLKGIKSHPLLKHSSLQLIIVSKEDIYNIKTIVKEYQFNYLFASDLNLSFLKSFLAPFLSSNEYANYSLLFSKDLFFQCLHSFLSHDVKSLQYLELPL